MSHNVSAALEQAMPASPLVLIVEDEEQIADIVSLIVQGAGYTPLVAFNGRHGLELARTRQPALLITDLMLPYLDGIALLAALQADAMTGGMQTPPSILLTAANLGLARTAGADVILQKPFNLAALEALLHRFLGPQSGATM
jgi:two-component system response regulator VicR